MEIDKLNTFLMEENRIWSNFIMFYEKVLS